MRVYNCKILLAGSRNNEVRRYNLSPAEVILLREIHGVDNVLDVKCDGEAPTYTLPENGTPNAARRVKWTDAFDRKRLEETYVIMGRPRLIEEVFGAAGAAWPQSVSDAHAPVLEDEFEPEFVDDEPVEERPDPIAVMAAQKKAANAKNPANLT